MRSGASPVRSPVGGAGRGGAASLPTRAGMMTVEAGGRSPGDGGDRVARQGRHGLSTAILASRGPEKMFPSRRSSRRRPLKCATDLLFQELTFSISAVLAPTGSGPV